MLRYMIAVFACFLAMASAQDNKEAPPFLKGATPDQIKQFYDMLDADKDKTDAEIDTDVQAFVQKLGENYPAQFDEFKANLKKGEAEYEKAHAAAVAKFSPAAKEADAKMTAIADDASLNGQQKSAQIKAIMDALPQNIQDEIKNALKD